VLTGHLRTERARPQGAALHSNLIVGLLQPGLKFVIDVVSGPYTHKVRVPLSTKRLVLDDASTTHDSAKRETRHEVILPRCQAGKANTRHTNETRLLRKNLHVAERAEQPDEPACQPQGAWIRSLEERFDGEVAT
jgi:hypothetical protein